MQKCKNCNSPFSWSKITKSIGWLYKPIECDNCGTKHKITILGRWTVAALCTLPILIFYFFLSSFNNDYVTIGIVLLIYSVILLFAPFVVRYKKEF